MNVSLVILKSIGGSYILLAITVIILLLRLSAYIIKRKHIKLEENEGLKYAERIKKEAVKINVPFDDCKVTERKSYTTVPASNDYTAQGLSSVFDSRNAEITTENVFSTIEVEVEVGGGTKTFVIYNLPFDRDTLLLKLYMQKEITIYYNKSMDDCLFDLSFLH